MSLSLQLNFWKMEFPNRLAQLRKERGLTQQQLADKIGSHVVQIRRYEAGASQPAVDVFKRLAIALSVSADTLLFDEVERDPDEDLRLQFEALSAMSPEEKQVAKSLLEAMIIKNHVAGAMAGTMVRAKPSLAKKKAAKEETKHMVKRKSA